MNVSVIIPAQASQAAALAASIEGVLAQRYAAGRIELIVVQYGGGRLAVPPAPPGRHLRLLAVDHPSPYAARNVAATEATGEAFLFTEPGCVPDHDWVAAHVARLGDSTVTLGVGRVAPGRATRLVNLFLSYEDVRDAWVFSQPRWQHLFGRPKNMAVARRRFASHGPFAEVMRGADSKLVQLVAREVERGEVALTPDAVVRQRSIRGLPSCLRDRFDHAVALQTHRSAHAAPISFAQRVRLFRDTLDRRGHGPLGAATLVVALAAGILAFRLGGWVGAARRRRG